jgi:cell division protein FtsB
MAASHTRIRWDRLGRIALLFVAALVIYLYIGPTRSWVTTYKQSKERKADVASLKRENERLSARRDELRKASTLETEARSLGMVRGGEKAYVISGLPGSHDGR